MKLKPWGVSLVLCSSFPPARPASSKHQIAIPDIRSGTKSRALQTAIKQSKFSLVPHISVTLSVAFTLEPQSNGGPRGPRAKAKNCAGRETTLWGYLEVVRDPQDLLQIMLRPGAIACWPCGLRALGGSPQSIGYHNLIFFLSSWLLEYCVIDFN